MSRHRRAPRSARDSQQYSGVRRCFRTAVRSPLACSLIAAIRLYRLASRRIRRGRSCLFRVSCSRHVEHVASKHGFRASIAAMKARFRSCRPNYTFEFDDTGWWVVCRDGYRIGCEEVAPSVVLEARVCLVPVDALPRRDTQIRLDARGQSEDDGLRYRPDETVASGSMMSTRWTDTTGLSRGDEWPLAECRPFGPGTAPASSVGPCTSPLRSWS